MIYRHERLWWLIEVEFYRDVWNVDDGIDLVAGLMIIAQTAGYPTKTHVTLKGLKHDYQTHTRATSTT